MHDQERRPTFIVPVEDYKQIVARLDETSLRDAYIGRWASRDAFGLHLLEDTSARDRLAQLPNWLRDHVRLDGESFVAELEAEGVYVVTPVESGVVVFDASCVRQRT